MSFRSRCAAFAAILAAIGCGRSNPGQRTTSTTDAANDVVTGIRLSEEPAVQDVPEFVDSQDVAVSNLTPELPDSAVETSLADSVSSGEILPGSLDGEPMLTVDVVVDAPEGNEFDAGEIPQPSDAKPFGDGASPQEVTVTGDGIVADGGCKDWRVRGDNKAPGDGCWNPPAHYCSSPWEAQLMWFGCNPEFTVCCQFYTQCRQCEWKKCPALAAGEPAPTGWATGCPDGDTIAAMKQQPELCKPFLPNYEDKFCYDDAPPAWSTMQFHFFDGL